MSEEQELAQLIAERIKNARNLRGLTQKQAGEKLGVDPNTWSNWEKGVRGVSAPTLVLIARALNFPLAMFTEKEYQVSLTSAESKKARRQRTPSKVPAR